MHVIRQQMQIAACMHCFERNNAKLQFCCCCICSCSQNEAEAERRAVKALANQAQAAAADNEKHEAPNIDDYIAQKKVSDASAHLLHHLKIVCNSLLAML